MSRRKQICSFLWKVWDIMKVRRRRVPSFNLPSARRISGSNASLTSVSHRQCHTAKRLRKEKLCRTAFDWHCLTQSFSEVKLRDERSEDIHKGVRKSSEGVREAQKRSGVSLLLFQVLLNGCRHGTCLRRRRGEVHSEARFFQCLLGGRTEASEAHVPLLEIGEVLYQRGVKSTSMSKSKGSLAG